MLESPITPLNRVQPLQAVDASVRSLPGALLPWDEQREVGRPKCVSSEQSNPKLHPEELLPDQTQGRREEGFTNSWVQTIILATLGFRVWVPYSKS